MYIQNKYKKNSMNLSHIILPLIGIIIIILMLIAIWFWEVSGRELYFYKEVVVLNQDVEKGTVINKDMLVYERYEADKIINDVVLTKDILIGLETKNFIPKGSQLHLNYFGDQEIAMTKDTYVVRIPNEWLHSIPNTLRRKDNIAFYEVSSSKNNELVNSFNGIDESTNTINNINPILLSKVAYVKDSANREVQTVSNEDRIDGNSVISEVSIIASTYQLNILENVINRGNKLIIMYTEGE